MKTTLNILLLFFFVAMMAVAFSSCEKQRKYRKLRDEVDRLTEVRIAQLEGAQEWIDSMNARLDSVKVLANKLHKQNEWFDSMYKYNGFKLVSYKKEFKRHVSMIDSICAGKEPCSGSLGFFETYNQQDAKASYIEDLWHKEILITKP